MSYQEELLIRIRSAYESGGFNKLDADLSRARSGYTQLQSTSARSTSAMSSQMSSASASVKSFGSTVVGAFDGLGGMITGVIAGYGLTTMATTAWTGATQAQLNKMLLTKKYGADMAESIVKNIQQIVAAVPGDDTFMNAFLSGVSRVGNISNVDTLKNVAYVASDYMNASLAAGKMGYEIQQDLTKYILYGNTAELERGSILSAQVDSLKNKATVEERVLAMNEAMKKLGLDGLSQLDSASNKWEEVKGNIQLVLTQFGTELLPYIQAAFKWFLNLNESTEGWAARIVVISGILIALVPIIGMLAGPFATGSALIWGMVSAVLGLKAASTGAAAGQQTLDAWLGSTANKSNQSSSAIRNFATSAAGATLIVAAMVVALIGMAYYMSQTNSASVAWTQAESVKNDKVAALKNNIGVLNNQIADLNKQRAQEVSSGLSTAAVDEQIRAKKAELQTATEGVTQAESDYQTALTQKQALEGTKTSQLTSAKTSAAAASEGKTPEQYLYDTGNQAEYNDALLKSATYYNNMIGPYNTMAGTLDKINKGQDTYSLSMKEDAKGFETYKQNYKAYAVESEKFFQAQEKGDVGGMLWYGVTSGAYQAAIGFQEFTNSARATLLDFGGSIQGAFGGAYTWIVSSWNGLPAWFGGLTAGIGKQWDDVVNYFNDKGTIGGQIYDGLKKIYCIIAGCSPGIIPTLGILYQTFVMVFNAILAPVMVARNMLMAFLTFIILQVTNVGNTVILIWNAVTGTVSVWIATGVNVATGAIDWAIVIWNQATGTISAWISTGVSVGTAAIDTARSIWDSFVNTVKQGVTGVVNVVFGSSSAGSPNEVDYLYGQGEYYESDFTPISSTSSVSSVATVTATTSKTVISPVFYIGSISSREEADYVIQKVTKELSDLNDAKGN